MSKLKHKENFLNQLDSEETVYKGNDYKGIFYNDNSEKKQYEGGAHFSYKELYKRLSDISKGVNDCSKSRTNFKHNELYHTKLKEKSDQIKQKLKFNQSSLSINKNFSTLKDKTNLNADKLRKKIIPDSNDALQKNIPVEFLPAKNINLTHLNVNFNLNFNNYNESTAKIKDRNLSSIKNIAKDSDKENTEIEEKFSNRNKLNGIPNIGRIGKINDKIIFKKVNPDFNSNKSQRNPSSKEPKGVINKNNLKNSNSFIQSISNKPYLKKPVLKDSYIFDNIESFKEHEVKPKNLNSKEIDELLSKINKIFMSSELKDLVVNNLSVKEGRSPYKSNNFLNYNTIIPKETVRNVSISHRSRFDTITNNQSSKSRNNESFKKTQHNYRTEKSPLNLQKEILVKSYRDDTSSTRSHGTCFQKKFSFNCLKSQMSPEKNNIMFSNIKVGKSSERHKRVSYDGHSYKII